MNRPFVDRIADAVLYEGYILYPYRPSTKNRQRWTFGGLFPEAYRRSPGDSDRSGFQAECLVRGTPATALDVRVRFLHLVSRQVGVFDPFLASWPPERPGQTPRPVESLRVGDRRYQTWQEAEEREVQSNDLSLGELLSRPHETDFAFAGRHVEEPIYGEAREAVGMLVREQHAVEGRIGLSAAEVGAGLFRVTTRVSCRSPLSGEAARQEALLRALVSTHAILVTRRGEFISLLDPPEASSEAAAACQNIGVWPVLVGEEAQSDTILASPIILYDYPQLAPESPGDLFDGLEIDEILSLRIMTLTDEEKGEMAAVDARARALLARTEALARDQFLNLHGTVRRPQSWLGGDS